MILLIHQEEQYVNIFVLIILQTIEKKRSSSHKTIEIYLLSLPTTNDKPPNNFVRLISLFIKRLFNISIRC
jgi:hypothetical protein